MHKYMYLVLIAAVFLGGCAVKQEPAPMPVLTEPTNAAAR